MVDGETLVPTQADPRLVLWQGDITRLRADAIVNAANSACWGAFTPATVHRQRHPLGGGPPAPGRVRGDHAGPGHPEPNGRAKLTKGYNLPARYVLHTVGPIVGQWVTWKDRRELAACYRSCLELAAELLLRLLLGQELSFQAAELPVSVRQVGVELPVGLLLGGQRLLEPPQLLRGGAVVRLGVDGDGPGLVLLGVIPERRPALPDVIVYSEKDVPVLGVGGIQLFPAEVHPPQKPSLNEIPSRYWSGAFSPARCCKRH